MVLRVGVEVLPGAAVGVVPCDEAAEVVVVEGDARVLAGDDELAQLPPRVQPEALLLAHLADVAAGVIVHLSDFDGKRMLYQSMYRHLGKTLYILT